MAWGTRWCVWGMGREGGSLAWHSFPCAFPILLKAQGDAGQKVSPHLPAAGLGLGVPVERKSLYHPNSDLPIAQIILIPALLLWCLTAGHLPAAYGSFWDFEASIICRCCKRTGCPCSDSNRQDLEVLWTVLMLMSWGFFNSLYLFPASSTGVRSFKL